MKAIVQDRYGSVEVLKLRGIDIPTVAYAEYAAASADSLALLPANGTFE